MKFNIFLLIITILLSGCTKKELQKETVKNEQITENITSSEEVVTGWTDVNTYTVRVVSENLDKGKEKARHQILRDIVKVRMVNESRFTDITKINAEFDKPLKNGQVVSEKKVEDGVEIYFQIRDEGLKQKFEKK